MSLSRERDRIRKRIERANAKGSPIQLSPTDEFALLPKYKRKEVLAEIALHRTETPVSAGHRIAAIKEINLMEHIYDGSQPLAGEIINNFVFVLPSGTKITPRALIEGEKDAVKQE